MWDVSLSNFDIIVVERERERERKTGRE